MNDLRFKNTVTVLMAPALGAAGSFDLWLSDGQLTLNLPAGYTGIKGATHCRFLTPAEAQQALSRRLTGTHTRLGELPAEAVKSQSIATLADRLRWAIKQGWAVPLPPSSLRAPVSLLDWAIHQVGIAGVATIANFIPSVSDAAARHVADRVEPQLVAWHDFRQTTAKPCLLAEADAAIAALCAGLRLGPPELVALANHWQMKAVAGQAAHQSRGATPATASRPRMVL